MHQKIRRSHLLLLLIPVVLFLFSLWKRAIVSDEPWVAEYAYWISKVGYAKSEIMRGFLDVDQKVYAHHKLFSVVGAWWIDLFGMTPVTMKMMSLFFFLASLLPLWLVFKRYSQSKNYFVLFLAIFLSLFHIIEYAFVYRPEIFLMFLGLLSFLFLDRYFTENRKSFLVLSGLFAAIATAGHLNGVVFVGAGVLLLWIYRRWAAGFFFGVLGSLGLVFFVTYDTNGSLVEIQKLFTQLTQWRDVASSNYHWTHFPLRFINEQERFLHSPPEMAYTFLLLCVLIPFRSFLYKNAPRLFLYPFLITLCLAAISHGKTAKYLLYAVPFFILLVTLALEEQARTKRYGWMKYAVALYFIASWGYEIDRFKSKEVMHPEYVKTAASLPEEAWILSTTNYFYASAGRQHLQSFVYYDDAVEAKKGSWSPEFLFSEAEKFNIDYIVLDTKYRKTYHIEPQNYFNYELLPEQPSKLLLVYKRR